MHCPESRESNEAKGTLLLGKPWEVGSQQPKLQTALQVRLRDAHRRGLRADRVRHLRRALGPLRPPRYGGRAAFYSTGMCA